MANFKNHKRVPMLVAVAVASASLLVAAESANAAGALFRAQQVWWFSTTNAQEWTDGQVWPTPGTMKHPTGLPPETAYVGSTTTVNGASAKPKFTIPYAFIKNTTYTFMCATTGTFMCYVGYPNSSGFYSYWNQEGHFRPENPYAATTPVTIRRRTVMDDFTGNGWASHVETVGVGKNKRQVTLPNHPPTVMFTLETPTEGGCIVGPNGTMTNPLTVKNKVSCPGTTQFNGAYTDSRAGSIMIFPANKRFGGTMRWFDGPNNRYFQRINLDGPSSTALSKALPLSQQIQGSVELTVGKVEAAPVVPRYRLTNNIKSPTMRLITGMTGNGGSCPTTGTPYFVTNNPPNHNGICQYYQRDVRYLYTRGPYTTGRIQQWQPFGNTNTVQSTTGYDNRTAMGLNGNISLVRPTLVHAYLSFPSYSKDANIPPTEMKWASARLKKMEYRFLPEPAGVAMLVAGFATLAGLSRLRKR